MAVSRQSYIRTLANGLVHNSTVPPKYRAKLQDLLRRNKILYVQRALRQTNLGWENVFGTAHIGSGKLRITSRAWSYWEGQNRPELVAEQIQKTLLHEVKHILLRTAGHPGGRINFDNDFKHIKWNGSTQASSKSSHLNTIKHITKSLIANTDIDYNSRVKLQELLQKNKILYIKQVFIRSSRGTRAAYSTARRASQEIIITERCWTYQRKKNTAKRTSAIIQQALLHEVKYFL
jgi:hypothetical protein